MAPRSGEEWRSLGFVAGAESREIGTTCELSPGRMCLSPPLYPFFGRERTWTTRSTSLPLVFMASLENSRGARTVRTWVADCLAGLRCSGSGPELAQAQEAGSEMGSDCFSTQGPGLRRLLPGQQQPTACCFFSTDITAYSQGVPGFLVQRLCQYSRGSWARRHL